MDTFANNNAGKLRCAQELLERSPTIFLHVDTRASSGAIVVVPPALRERAQLVLQVGRNMEIPIPDLRFGEWGMLATLSFGRQPFSCLVPWSAVKAIVDETGLGAVFDPEWQREVETPVEPSGVRRHLRLVKS